MPMHSSGEELGLLLSKWKNDSAKVAVISLLVENDDWDHLRASCVVIGNISALDMEKQTFGIADHANGFFLNYSGCVVLYHGEAEEELRILNLIERDDIEDLIYVRSPSQGFAICHLKAGSGKL